MRRRGEMPQSMVASNSIAQLDIGYLQSTSSGLKSKTPRCCHIFFDVPSNLAQILPSCIAGKLNELHFYYHLSPSKPQSSKLFGGS